MNHDNLIAAGYKRYKVSQNYWLNHADALYQKEIRGGDRSKLFFINIFWYDWRKYADVADPEGWQPEVQFNGRRDASPTFNVTLIPDKMTIEEVEAFFWKIYTAMGCSPYGD